MGIYKDPSIYKSGISEKEIFEKLSKSWVDISNKMGTLDTANGEGRVDIRYSYELSLILITLYYVYNNEITMSAGSTSTIFNFKNDLPGNNDNRLFVGEIACAGFSSSTNNSYPILAIARPYNFSDANLSYKIYTKAQQNQSAKIKQISGYYLLTPINGNLNEQFKNWLDNQ